MAFTFEKLVVYQKAIDFADAICQETEGFTRGSGFPVDQLNRAAISIAANIAEGTAASQSLIEGTSSGSREVPFRNACRCSNWLVDEISCQKSIIFDSRPTSKRSPECSPV